MKNEKFIVQIESHFIFLLASPLSRAIKLRKEFATISFAYEIKELRAII